MPEEKPVAGSERLVKLLGIYSRLIGAEVKKLENCFTRLEELKEEIEALTDGVDYAKSSVAESVATLEQGCEEIAEAFIKLDDLREEREAAKSSGFVEGVDFEVLDNDDTNGFAEVEVEFEEDESSEEDDADDENTEDESQLQSSLLTEEDVGAVVGP